MVNSASSLLLKDRVLTTELPAFVMSIINCTPDSFWEKSRLQSKNNGEIQKNTEWILEQFENGADIVDIGGESTRPGANYVEADEEMERIIPLVQAVRKYSTGVISIDTRKSLVMKEAIKAGADILNDISALEDDEKLVSLVANEKIPVILMHKRQNPLTMQQDTVYNNIVKDIANYLAERVNYAMRHGIDSSKIILDAGIGFAKDTFANIELIKASNELEKIIKEEYGLTTYGFLMALSRKTCIGDITGRAVDKRLAGTLTANILAVQKGAKILRVHDVQETVDALKVLKEIGL